MGTKEEISRKLNELLKLSVDWTKLSKEELDNIEELLGDPGKLIQLGVKGVRTHVKEEVLNRPLKDVLANLEGLAGKKGKGRGLFGLGLIPIVFPNEEAKKPP